jgi:hypothetical protein
MNESPSISSFVIRFIQEPADSGQNSYRGTIRHVQTNQELVFTEWKEATTFIHRFVPIDECDPIQPDNPNS